MKGNEKFTIRDTKMEQGTGLPLFHCWNKIQDIYDSYTNWEFAVGNSASLNPEELYHSTQGIEESIHIDINIEHIKRYYVRKNVYGSYWHFDIVYNVYEAGNRNYET